MPSGKALPAEIVADFETWIRGGAPMPADATPHAGVSRNFWSLRPPQDAALPKVQHADRARTAIDQFILAKLQCRDCKVTQRIRGPHAEEHPNPDCEQPLTLINFRNAIHSLTVLVLRTAGTR